MAMAFALCCVSCSEDDDDITPPNILNVEGTGIHFMMMELAY